MTRKQRLFVPDGVYHVYCRISRGEFVFSRDGEAERLVAELQRVKRRDGLVVFAYAIMPNHYHISLRTSVVPLWRSMAAVQGRFAKAHNRKRGVRGPLWQSRYRARVVDSEIYFNQLLAYIHLNPVSARLVDDPIDYRWSGHAELLGLRRPQLVDADEVLRTFGDARGVARQRYLDHIRCCAEMRLMREGVWSLPWWRQVTDDYETVKPKAGQEYRDYREQRINVERPDVAIGEIVRISCEHLDVEMSRVAGRTKRGRVTDARVIITLLRNGGKKSVHFRRFTCGHGPGVSDSCFLVI